VLGLGPPPKGEGVDFEPRELTGGGSGIIISFGAGFGGGSSQEKGNLNPGVIWTVSKGSLQGNEKFFKGAGNSSKKGLYPGRESRGKPPIRGVSMGSGVTLGGGLFGVPAKGNGP